MASDDGMERYWDARAADDAYFYVDNRLSYGNPNTDRFWSGGADDLATLLGLVGAELAADEQVVEIGCGLGRLTRVIADQAAAVHALDISSEMLRQAQDLNPTLSNVTWVHGDGTSLAGIQGASADACISHVVFQHIPDPAITLGYITEMGRILRPGGWSAFQVSTDPRVHSRSLGQRLRDRVRALRQEGAPGMTDPNWLGSAVQMDSLRSTAANAGLAVANVTGEGTQYCIVKLVKQ